MWWIIAVFIVSLVLAYAFMPKPQVQKPAEVQSVDAPTVEVGKEICVLFGTRDLTDPNITYYGALRLVPIKSKSGGKK